MAFTYPYPRPSVTLDVIYFALGGDCPRLLLIRRAQKPFAKTWALPGGFLDMDEGLEHGARRELMEETGVEVGPLAQVGAFGDVGRDPRGRTVSVGFVGVRLDAPPPPRSGDDASDAQWHTVRRLPKLAFDHGMVIRTTRSWLVEASKNPTRLVALLPPRFTLNELQTLHEFAAGKTADANFASRCRRQDLLRPTKAKRGRATLFASKPTPSHLRP